MTYEERAAYIKALMYISTLDEKVEEEELQYLNQLGQVYGIEAAEMAEIKESVLKKKHTLEEILNPITNRKVKLALVFELLALCYADNSYDVLEKQGMRKVCRILAIEDNKLIDMEKVMLENIELQKKINTILERE